MKRLTMSLGFAIIAVACVCAFPLFAQDVTLPLDAQIATKFKASPRNPDGTLRLEGGTLLVIRKTGVAGIPPGQIRFPAGTYKDGVLKPPSYVDRALTATNDLPWRDLIAGEWVYLAELEIKGDKVIFVVIECDVCNGTTVVSMYRAAVTFEFPKGFLKTASLSQVQSTIEQVFAIDTTEKGLREAATGKYTNVRDSTDELVLLSSGSFALRLRGKVYSGIFFNAGERLSLNVASKPFTSETIKGDTITDTLGIVWTKQVPLESIPPPPPPPDTAPVEPATISLGLTIDQVVAVLGQPVTVADLGSKKIYTYKNLKVTFVDGKVTDVQ